MDKRARHARAILTRGANAELCYELFGSYLLKNAKDLVTGFLDKTGVPHKEGMIDDVENDTPAGDKVAAAVAELDKEFDPADVTLYLSWRPSSGRRCPRWTPPGRCAPEARLVARSPLRSADVLADLRRSRSLPARRARGLASARGRGAHASSRPAQVVRRGLPRARAQGERALHEPPRARGGEGRAEGRRAVEATGRGRSARSCAPAWRRARPPRTGARGSP